ncbi:hypothetical protein AAF712_011524, partial [Marasmius tenuissimus]
DYDHKFFDHWIDTYFRQNQTYIIRIIEAHVAKLSTASCLHGDERLMIKGTKNPMVLLNFDRAGIEPEACIKIVSSNVPDEWGQLMYLIQELFVEKWRSSQVSKDGLVIWSVPERQKSNPMRVAGVF